MVCDFDQCRHVLEEVARLEAQLLGDLNDILMVRHSRMS